MNIENYKISVIVPSYNSERYISRCLNSLINQTYKNLEIIVVDDCSTDNSYQIVKEFQNKHNNIISLRNENNKKTFETRRVGMKAATGDYIGFCDSDDFHESNAFEYLLNLILKNDYDMSSGIFVHNENNWPCPKNSIIYTLNNYDLYKNLFNKKEIHHLSTSLFKKEVIKKSLEEIPENINISNADDFLLFGIIYYNVKSYIHGDKSIYNYCRNEMSVSKSKGVNTALARVIDYSKVYYYLEQLLINRNQYETYKTQLANIGMGMAKAAMERLKNNADNYIELWEKNSSEAMKKLLINNILSNKLQESIDFKNFKDKISKIETEIKNLKDNVFEIENNINHLNIYNNNLNNILGNIINTIVWWIPIRKLRDNFRNKMLRPDQTRPDQTRPDQTRPDQTRGRNYVCLNDIIIMDKLQAVFY